MASGVIRIGYERLFNMGNYEHEKYTISLDAEGVNEYEVMKQISLEITELEEDINRYRGLLIERANLLTNIEHFKELDMVAETAKFEQRLVIVEALIKAFREEHKPVYKPCNCYYCTHVDDDPEDE